MRRWRAASSPSSTRRRCAGSAARCRAPACWPSDAVAKALTALRRFRALCRIQQVGRVYRHRHRRLPRRLERPRLHRQGRAHLRRRIEILSGPREAKLSALGVVSGIHNPDGVVGDLGGGSLELIDVHGSRVSQRRHAAARKPGAAGPVGQIAEARRTHRQQRSVQRGPAQGRPAAAPSTRSAAPGARWRASTSSRATIRCG